MPSEISTSEIISTALSIKEFDGRNNFVCTTNVENPITINGVAKGFNENDRSNEQYILLYSLFRKREKAIINKETYNLVRQLFDMLLDLNEGNIDQGVNILPESPVT